MIKYRRRIGNTTQVCASISPECVELLDELSIKTHKSKSWIIEEAINLYSNDNTKKADLLATINEMKKLLANVETDQEGK